MKKKITAVASQYLLRDAGAHMHYSGGVEGRGYAGNSTMQAMHALHALHTTFYNQVPATQAGDLKSLKLSTEGPSPSFILHGPESPYTSIFR